MRNVNATFIQQAYTHYTIKIKCINYTGLPKYIYLSLTACCGDLWESELGITSTWLSLFFWGGGGILFLVDDRVSQEMTLGGFKAVLELPILLVLESLQPVHLLFTISLLMF